MTKAAVVLLAGTGSHADMGRAANALETVKQFQKARDEVRLLFDGAGTQWVPELADPDHKLHGDFEAVQKSIAGACEFCANAFHVVEEVRSSSVPLLDEHDGHPDVHGLVDEGFEIITF